MKENYSYRFILSAVVFSVGILTGCGQQPSKKMEQELTEARRQAQQAEERLQSVKTKFRKSQTTKIQLIQRAADKKVAVAEEERDMLDREYRLEIIKLKKILMN